MRHLSRLACAAFVLSLTACSGQDSLGVKGNPVGNGGKAGSAGSAGTDGSGGNVGSGGNGGLACAGPDPSKGCDEGCPSGTVCDPDACRSSHCACDPNTGYWQCTADCGEGGACVPDDGNSSSCVGPDPSAPCDPKTCGSAQGYSCQPDNCKPSACGCSPEGFWQCTADCGTGTTCVKLDTCPGTDPSQDCTPTSCPDGSSCKADNCKPSGCACTKQGWVCDLSCHAGLSCVPN